MFDHGCEDRKNRHDQSDSVLSCHHAHGARVCSGGRAPDGNVAQTGSGSARLFRRSIDLRGMVLFGLDHLWRAGGESFFSRDAAGWRQKGRVSIVIIDVSEAVERGTVWRESCGRDIRSCIEKYNNGHPTRLGAPVPVLCRPLQLYPHYRRPHTADSYFIFPLAGTQLDQRFSSDTRTEGPSFLWRFVGLISSIFKNPVAYTADN